MGILKVRWSFECPCCGDKLKFCPKCKQLLPFDPEFFYRNKRGCGLQSWCKACMDENREQHRSKNKESQLRARRLARQWKAAMELLSAQDVVCSTPIQETRM